MAAPRIALLAFALIAALSCVGAREASATTQSPLGDVDCDGSVTAKDASLLLQRSAGLLQEVACEKSDDVDENGVTDATDAAFVLQYVAALIPILPAPAVALANIPTQCPEQAELTDGAIMATDILTRTTHDLFLPRGQRITMGQELDGVLARVRELEPAVENVEPRPQFALGSIILYLGPDLYEQIYALLEGSPESVAFVLNDPGFDALNVRLRLVGFEPLLTIAGETFAPFRLCYPFHINVPAVAAAFQALEDVYTAGGEEPLGDAPDIEALKDGDTWYVVVRDAFGDCPSGCTGEALYYFIDNGEATAQVDEADALENERFILLACYVRDQSLCDAGPA